MSTPEVTPHGTILMIAWGMSEVGYEQFKELRYQLSRELQPHKLLLKVKGGGAGYILRQRRKHISAHDRRKRSNCLWNGTLQECCRRALSEIDPDNYPLGPKAPVTFVESRTYFNQPGVGRAYRKGNHP